LRNRAPQHTTARAVSERTGHSGVTDAAVIDDVLPATLPADALDDRIAIVGTAGSGKTYAAKGFVERLLDSGARVAIVDSLGVWWGLRASADGSEAGYPVVVFGGKHADVPITAEMGAALGWMIASEALACVVDLSELGSNAARRRFMAAFFRSALRDERGAAAPGAR
jgi:DNA helicase HerA-like ATPase